MIKKIFCTTAENFNAVALEMFKYQYHFNEVYQQYVNALQVNIHHISRIEDIPFLPISFFKSHQVICHTFQPQAVFESSGTTGTINSRHYVKDIKIYEKSFLKGFELFYNQPDEWCIIGLLPAYLERQHSSLVYMVNELIQRSKHPQSGFYLHEFDTLSATLKTLAQNQQKTLLIGVTFALLDFAEKYSMPLHNVTIMETGGMKGRRKELIRPEVHATLQQAFNVPHIHSEYGMTELLSQAYSKENGIFATPPWMRVLLRDAEDPLSVFNTKNETKKRGLINIIDLANIHSCAFIATDDEGLLHENNCFEVLGRRDNSDLRGCSLMAL